jgi:hypothetical protein
VNERLVTLVCALGALALFLAMFLRGGDANNGRGDVASPTSEERRANGYHGAMMWLDEEHIRTVSLRDRFDTLSTARFGLPASGNLLIVTLPVVTTFKTEEFRALDNWVRAGNTLLVLAALADEPDWAFALGRPAFADLGLLSGLEFDTARGAKGDAADVGARIAATARAYSQPLRVTLVPNGQHPYFNGIGTAVALSDYPAQRWRVKVPYDGFVLSLAHLRDTSDGVLWTRALGNGRIIVSGLGSLFTNRALGLEDNARLLANIVGTTVGPRGAVLFDDLHQGLGSAYDPAKFYGDRRLYETVAILAALWLCWVLGATKLQLPRTGVSVPREAELVKVTGGFLARVLTSDAGALGLFDHFFKRMIERLPPGRTHASPPWELLGGHAGVTPVEVRRLQGWYADARAARHVPLVRLHNLLRKIDRQIST